MENSNTCSAKRVEKKTYCQNNEELLLSPENEEEELDLNGLNPFSVPFNVYMQSGSTKKYYRKVEHR